MLNAPYFTGLAVPNQIAMLLSKLRTHDDGRRMAEVIEARFGLIDGNKHTLEEIGGRFGLTRERIRQIEQRALEYLKRFAREAENSSLIDTLFDIRSKAQENAKQNKRTRILKIPSPVSAPAARCIAPTMAQLSAMRQQVYRGMEHLQSLGIDITI